MPVCVIFSDCDYECETLSSCVCLNGVYNGMRHFVDFNTYHTQCNVPWILIHSYVRTHQSKQKHKSSSSIWMNIEINSVFPCGNVSKNN